MFLLCKCLSATRIYRGEVTYLTLIVKRKETVQVEKITWVTRNFVMRSDSLPFSLERIISNMSPFSFSMTTKIRSGVSNMRSKLTTPG